MPRESDDEGVFTVLEFTFREQVQFETYIYRVVENSSGYPNIYDTVDMRI